MSIYLSIKFYGELTHNKMIGSCIQKLFGILINTIIDEPPVVDAYPEMQS